MKKLSVVIICFLVLSCTSERGIKAIYCQLGIQEIQQRYGGEFGALADELKEAGVTAVISPVFRDGTAFYPSDILPRRWENGSQMLAFRHELRRRNIDFIAGIQVFQDHYVYGSRPEMRPVSHLGNRNSMEKTGMICPSFEDYRRYKLSIIEEIMLIFQPEGLCLDHCYFPVDWQSVPEEIKSARLYDNAFCGQSLKQFEKYAAVDLPDENLKTYEISEWIYSVKSQEWMSWKTSLITEFIELLYRDVKDINPDCYIMLESIPWEQLSRQNGLRVLGGTDFKTLSTYIDYLLPMTDQLEKNTIDDIDRLLQDFSNPEMKICPGLSVSQFDSEEDFRDYLQHYMENIVVKNWESMLKYRRYLNVFKSE